MMIDVLKKSINSKFWNILFNKFLKINLLDLIDPKIFIFKLDNLNLDIKIFYDFAHRNPHTNYMADQDDTYQSNHDIETKSEFKDIKIQIENFLDKKLKNKIFKKNTLGKFKLKSMWFVIMKKNSHHNMHSHPKSAFTGVIYLKVNKNEASSALKVLIPKFNKDKYKLDNFYNQIIDKKTNLIDEKKNQIELIDKKLFNFIPDNNDMIIFNSYMIHGIDKYESKEDRIALAWDAVYTI